MSEAIVFRAIDPEWKSTRKPCSAKTNGVPRCPWKVDTVDDLVTDWMTLLRGNFSGWRS